MGAPTLILLDDVDTMFDKRVGQAQGTPNASLIATLLLELDGLQLVTGIDPAICAT